MVNKRGWIRIVEASIAVMIIFSVIIFVTQKRQTQSEQNFSENLQSLLEEVAKNATLRENIIKNPNTNEVEIMIKNFLATRMDSSYLAYDIRVCPTNDVCGLSKYPDTKGDIYSEERVVSSTLSAASLSPKKVKIFMWFK